MGVLPTDDKSEMGQGMEKLVNDLTLLHLPCIMESVRGCRPVTPRVK